MTIRELESIVAKREGKKSNVKIGDIREILRIIRDLIQERPVDVLRVLIK